MRSFWNRNFLWLEPAAALVITGGFVIWVEGFGGKACVAEVLKDNRSSVYSALASVFGALLGFVLTAVSVVFGFSSMPRFKLLRESPHYRTLYNVYLNTTWILALATVMSLVALVIDRDVRPHLVIMYAVFLLGSVATVRIARCVWALERMILIITEQRRETPAR